MMVKSSKRNGIPREEMARYRSKFRAKVGVPKLRRVSRRDLCPRVWLSTESIEEFCVEGCVMRIEYREVGEASVLDLEFICRNESTSLYRSSADEQCYYIDSGILYREGDRGYVIVGTGARVAGEGSTPSEEAGVLELLAEHAELSNTALNRLTVVIRNNIREIERIKDNVDHLAEMIGMVVDSRRIFNDGKVSEAQSE